MCSELVCAVLGELVCAVLGELVCAVSCCVCSAW